MDTRRYRTASLAVAALILAACAAPPPEPPKFIDEVRSVCKLVEGHRVEYQNEDCVVCQAEGHAVAACTVK